MVGLINQSCIGEGALTLGAHLGEDMAFEGVLPLDFTRASVGESLFGAGVGFHFWHVVPL